MLRNCQINGFRILNHVGSGAYGLVLHVEEIATGRQLAMKIILKRTLSSVAKRGTKRNDLMMNTLLTYLQTHDNVLNFPCVDLDSIHNITNEQLADVPHYRELQLHLRVNTHPNIVTIHQVLESPLATCIVMDYYEKDLFTAIAEEGHFAKDGLLIKKVMLQLCSALEHCSRANVFHCDLKPENILLDSNDNVYLCDFGLATHSDILEPNVCIGSSYYMAPERISQGDSFLMYPTLKGDIWSLGILLVNLTCIRNPWSKAHHLEDKTFAHFLKNQSILQTILPISDELLVLLKKVLKLNPFARIGLTQLREEIGAIRSFTKEGPLTRCRAVQKRSTIQTIQSPHLSDIFSIYSDAQTTTTTSCESDTDSLQKQPTGNYLHEPSAYNRGPSDVVRNNLLQFQLNVSTQQRIPNTVSYCNKSPF
ncbi:putative serine/threonine protein kinase SKS1 KNAG_0A02350 [Huiozyma naganishii CBS 8797]|uniref:non-specific serine/threonine protein kinase n=1 Tax=Huiozyma naganishii (strain ATCC MYA-139 / BCRC 22969 / CBS 8797 / KCTC 17520 / NBRC 10181 / NCYC 3082 / Yp74L-3) TaxID=1071383 RepID=J7S211_HUIN7|nr:hypothetical protein KNAG_0A02350 [Kazachstania naganishii CBS 8797]CCK67924.1 hypothetical protein KNAG_0A02350 [Kazachstania naganishii CBS 8797]